MSAIIRLEEERDCRAAENLTREAFWNKYRPGCDEHFVLHRFRALPDFIPELDWLIEEAGEIVAHIMYCRTQAVADGGGALPLVTFGPVSVLPQRQGEGFGSRLIRFTLEKAAALGFGAVAITGSPNYYHRFGFVSGDSLGIRYAEVPRGEEAPFFMVRELLPGYLDGFRGSYSDPDGYRVDAAALEEFDRSFPPKEKKQLPGQLF